MDPMAEEMALNGMMPEHEEVQTLARESIDAAVGSSAFTLAKVDTWTSNIVENCLKVRTQRMQRQSHECGNRHARVEWPDTVVSILCARRADGPSASET